MSLGVFALKLRSLNSYAASGGGRRGGRRRPKEKAGAHKVTRVLNDGATTRNKSGSSTTPQWRAQSRPQRSGASGSGTGMSLWCACVCNDTVSACRSQILYSQPTPVTVSMTRTSNTPRWSAAPSLAKLVLSFTYIKAKVYARLAQAASDYSVRAAASSNRRMRGTIVAGFWCNPSSSSALS